MIVNHPSPDKHTRASILAEVVQAMRTGDGLATDIESVIARTTLSVGQVEDEFDGLHDLILAMVGQLSALMCSPLEHPPTRLNFRQNLLAFGESVANVYSYSHLPMLYRIALTEAIRRTGLGPDFYRIGPGQVADRLADYLGQAKAAGAFASSADTRPLASHFMALLRAQLDLSDTFPNDRTNKLDRGDPAVAEAVEMFCNGIKTGKSC